MNFHRYAFALLMVALLTSSANAYIGPGLSGGAGAVIIGFIASIFLALFAILWYPFKRLIRKFKKQPTEDTAAKATEDASTPTSEPGSDAPTEPADKVAAKE